MTRIFEQSAVIPYRFAQKDIQVLLITSLKKNRWIIPKGLIDEDKTAMDSAANEAYEEAGISGNIDPELLGFYEYRKWGGLCRVSVYKMQVIKVLDDWPEKSMRRRKWFSYDQAVKLLKEKDLKTIVARFYSELSGQRDF